MENLWKPVVLVRVTWCPSSVSAQLRDLVKQARIFDRFVSMARSQGRQRPASTRLRVAKEAGLVRRAHRPFQAFLAETRMTVAAGSRRWKAMTDQEQEYYREASNKSFQLQRQDAAAAGVLRGARAKASQAPAATGTGIPPPGVVLGGQYEVPKPFSQTCSALRFWEDTGRCIAQVAQSTGSVWMSEATRWQRAYVRPLA